MSNYHSKYLYQFIISSCSTRLNHFHLIDFLFISITYWDFLTFLYQIEFLKYQISKYYFIPRIAMFLIIVLLILSLSFNNYKISLDTLFVVVSLYYWVFYFNSWIPITTFWLFQIIIIIINISSTIPFKKCLILIISQIFQLIFNQVIIFTTNTIS